MDQWLNIFSAKAVVLELLLITVCVLDDSPVKPSFFNENHLARAMVDSLTHGVIAALSWLLVTDIQMTVRNLTEVSLCAFLAMVIDVDHFIAAGSLSLSAATSLSKRPFLHNSSLVVIVFLLLLCLQRCAQLASTHASTPWIFLLAWTSHHLRDGVRRGLWFAPFGSTAAVPKWMFVCVVSLCPIALKAVFLLLRSRNIHRGNRNMGATDRHESASLLSV